MSADGRIMPTIVDEQIPAIENLHFDYSKFLDKNGTQLQTVGHHYRLSAPLSKAQRDKLDRSGVCFGCHQDIPKGNLAVSAMSHIAQMAKINIDNNTHKKILNKTLNIAAWFQILGVAFVVILFIYFKFIKRKSRERRWR